MVMNRFYVSSHETVLLLFANHTKNDYLSEGYQKNTFDSAGLFDESVSDPLEQSVTTISSARFS